MTFFLILLAFLALWALAGLVTVVRADGYGLRPPPPSHPDEVVTRRGVRA